jgi:hypothetical protein
MKLILVRIGISVALLVCLVFTLTALRPTSRPIAIPSTNHSFTGNRQDTNVNNTVTAFLPTLSDFINSVSNTTQPNQITGVYIPDKMAYPVVDQPGNDPGYVSTLPGTVTQFEAAKKFKSIGLLAHNYLAGNTFSQIEDGDLVTLVYGDGDTRTFWVYTISRYQALSPNDPYSDFIDLNNPTKILSSTDLFNKTYGMGVLVMQTCIQNGDESSWGRMFIMALPIDETSETELAPQAAVLPIFAFPGPFTLNPALSIA